MESKTKVLSGLLIPLKDFTDGTVDVLRPHVYNTIMTQFSLAHRSFFPPYYILGILSFPSPPHKYLSSVPL